MQTILEVQNNENKPNKSYVIIVIAIVSLSSLLSYFFWPAEGDNSANIDRDSLVISTVETGHLIQDVRAPGNLTSKHRQWLSASVSAKVIKRELQPGAVVTPDSIILRLSSPELSQEYKRVKIDFKVAKAQLDALKETQLTAMQKQQADVKLLEIEKQQAVEDAAVKKQLRVEKIIPLFQYNRALLLEKKLTLELEIAEFELQQLPRLQTSLRNVEEAKVEQQLLQVTLLSEQVEMLNVRAQIHGVLQSISVEEGQEVAQGTTLARVADQNNLKAELRVQESQAKDIRLGQTVEIDTRRSKIKGVVARINPAVVDGTVTIDVDLPKDLPREARPDLRVNGIVEISRLENVLLLDKPAHWKNSKTAYLYKLNGDSQAIRTKVAIGATSTNSIQLLSGVTKGEQVILSDTSQLQRYASLTLN
ncbi:MAG: HlyD family secretion protein [Paraglaciecola sp.]|jgi:HlyD family secretion protein